MNWIKLFICWVILCGAVASAWGIGGLPSHNASLTGLVCSGSGLGNVALNNTWSSFNSGTVTISLSASSTVIVTVHMAVPSPGGVPAVSSVVSNHMTFAKHQSISQTDSGSDTNRQTAEIWWAHTSAPLVSEVITVTSAANIDTATIVGAEYKCLHNPPWDTNANSSGSNGANGGVATCPSAATLASNSSRPTVIWTNTSVQANGGNPSGFTAYASGASNLGAATNSEQRNSFDSFPGAISGAQYTVGAGSNSWMVMCNAVTQ